METYVYECVHRYDPADHGHEKNYILIEPRDRLEVDTPFKFPIEGSPEEPKVC